MTLYSIAPHARFLQVLAEKVVDGTLLGDWDRSQPFWLSDVTIIVPTRRARVALADEFGRLGQLMLPDIRTFGGEAEDEEPFLPPFDAPTPLPAATPLERRLVLSRLVHAWAHSPAGREAFSTPPTAGEILGMAESLGSLIDDLLIEERSAADIRAIIPELDSNLGAYWQQTLRFLDIALQYWPAHLASRHRADAAALRGQRLDRQAMAAPLVYGDRPVIAAGSTGSIAATARLLKAIQGLPRGSLVLPGFDCRMTSADHAALLDDSHNPHGHPQYGLAKLLRRLDAGVGDVIELVPAESPRTTMVSRALALTKDTARWAELRMSAADLDSASDGLAVIQARNEDEEARAIALAARQALEDGRSVGVVTPDRNLARRIAAELRRFDVLVDDSAGAPLFQSPAGRLLRQILALAVNQCSAVDLVSILRNRAVRFGLERPTVTALTDALELGLLRGQRPGPGLDSLRSMLAASLEKRLLHPARQLTQADGTAISGLLDQVDRALAPLLDLLKKPEIEAHTFVAALHTAFIAFADGAELPGRPEMEAWAAEVAEQGDGGQPFAPQQLEGVLAALMLGVQVRTHGLRRDDIAIWGQLEARLQNPDLLILAGLNEDKWPEAADPGPWLSRGMRLAAGLEPPERRQGQAAHDFAQAMGNGDVIVSYADRVGASPAIASRLVQRLDAFAGGEAARRWRDKGRAWLDQARRIDAVTAVTPATRPLPSPPAALRPRRLSITEIETLMRSPYDLYARHVLGLRPLDPLGLAPDARERGTITHDIFAQFVIDNHDFMAPDALAQLQAIATGKFAGLAGIADRRDIWLRRFTTAAEQFLLYERGRNPLVRKRHAEISGRWTLKLAEDFILTGRADRVDEMADGTLEMIDFKTGTVPSKGAMQAFEVPQLLLEAQMGRAGALQGIAPADTSRLTYIKIGLGPDAFVPKDFVPADGFDLMAAADELSRRMQGHVVHFLFNGAVAMPSRLLPLKGQRFAGAYDHLARVAEWTVSDGEEGEP
ncbi:MAG TPA: double-strand break repair protein AddB [Devosia sp.]|jgi:ATP-dependent helicase/nuclease subunit B|uniref:double-strand break repair protein AddB n=1 Tax=Devosia sp. TaxID=1871048 RepID=UPI002F939C4F